MEEKFLNKAGVQRLWANICTLLQESVETIEEQKISMSIVDSLPTDNIIPNVIYLVPVPDIEEVSENEI